jgi:hypothetical protein
MNAWSQSPVSFLIVVVLMYFVLPAYRIVPDSWKRRHRLGWEWVFMSAFLLNLSWSLLHDCLFPMSIIGSLIMQLGVIGFVDLLYCHFEVPVNLDVKRWLWLRRAAALVLIPVWVLAADEGRINLKDTFPLPVPIIMITFVLAALAFVGSQFQLFRARKKQFHKQEAEPAP